MSGFHTSQAIKGNLTWSPDGTVSATYIVPSHDPKLLPPELRLRWHRQWTGAYAILPGPFVHEALDRQEPVNAVMARMAGAIPGGSLSEFPMWEKRMQDTANFLRGLSQPPVEKWQRLTVVLPVPARPQSRNAFAWAGAMLTGAPPPPPSEDAISVAEKQDTMLFRRLRTLVPGARRARSGELRWLTGFAETFGGAEPPHTHERFASNSTDMAVLTPLAEAILNDVHPRLLNRIQIDAPCLDDDGRYAGRQTSHQAYFVVNDFADRWHYPAAALGDDLDALPFPIRVAAFGRPVPNAKALKGLNPLFKELDWMSSETGSDHTPNISAAQAQERLDTELAALTRHKGPSIPSGIVVGISADSVEELEDRASHLIDALDSTHTRLLRPRGRQTDIWLALHPGSPVPRLLRALERHVHSTDLAALGLFHGSKFGDQTGRVWAVMADGDEDAPPRLVYRNVMRGPKDADGNQGATRIDLGDLGAGKSLDAKTDCADVLALGGGVYVFDRSVQREWTEASQAWGTDVSVIDPSSTNVTIDPLRVFTANLPEDATERADALINAEKHTLGYLALVCFVGQEDDVRYDVLKTAVTDLLRDNPPLSPSLPNLLKLLRYRSGEQFGDGHDLDRPPYLPTGMRDPRFFPLTSPIHLEAAATLVGRLQNVARSALTGRSLFSGGRPLDLSTPAVIFSAPGLKVTDRDAKATIYLAVAFSLAFLYATPRFNLLRLSEFAALAHDPWGAELIDDATRQTRRSNSGLGADTQLDRDVPNPELFIVRTVGRTRDEGAARGALRLLGVKDPGVELVSALTEAENGVKLARDGDGNIAWIDVLPPLDPEEFFLYRTDPEKRRITERV